MIKGCIFDLDGVIVDSAKYHFIAWKALASSLGIDFTEKQNENLKGVGRMESLDYILSLGKLNKSYLEKLELADSKNEHYKSLISKMDSSEILPGVLDFLNELKNLNIKIALGSSSKNARIILKTVGVTDYFDAIVDGTNISKSKPDPEVFMIGAESLNLIPENIVVFEDAYQGIEAANRGGFISVGVGSAQELNNAHYNISGFENLRFEILLDSIMKKV